MEVILILILALILDLTLGEPPSVVHPVVWIGKATNLLIKAGKGHAPATQFIIGLGTVILITGMFSAPVYFLLSYFHHVNIILYIIIGALILKTSFSLKELRNAAKIIRDLLKEEKLSQARFELRALVGRDTSQLDKNLIISATIESVAENICDSFFAPLFYFAFLGVTGAVAYRAVNTLDAMMGHHGEYEYLGKLAAKLDTVANYIPARLAALTIILASRIAKAKANTAWKTMLKDHRKTESPNAGWTMSAMAGALEVRLEKVNYYRLGENYNPLVIQTINASLKIVTIAAATWSLLIVIAEVVYHVAT